MSEVKRYDCSGTMCQAEGGDWVCVELLQSAQSELAVLSEHIELLTADLAWSENDSRDQSKELAALREELAIKAEAYQGAHMMCTDLKASLTAAEQRNAVRDIESAAKVLANCMDYPWEHMPENGRVLMRKHAKDVIDAALGE